MIGDLFQFVIVEQFIEHAYDVDDLARMFAHGAIGQLEGRRHCLNRRSFASAQCNSRPGKSIFVCRRMVRVSPTMRRAHSSIRWPSGVKPLET
jgi:hypothetical protein